MCHKVRNRYVQIAALLPCVGQELLHELLLWLAGPARPPCCKAVATRPCHLAHQLRQRPAIVQLQQQHAEAALPAGTDSSSGNGSGGERAGVSGSGWVGMQTCPALLSPAYESDRSPCVHQEKVMMTCAGLALTEVGCAGAPRPAGGGVASATAGAVAHIHMPHLYMSAAGEARPCCSTSGAQYCHVPWGQKEGGQRAGRCKE